jgi:hypothetical protein
MDICIIDLLKYVRVQNFLFRSFPNLQQQKCAYVTIFGIFQNI